MRKVKSILVTIERQSACYGRVTAEPPLGPWEMTVRVRLERDAAVMGSQPVHMECIAVLNPQILDPGFEELWTQAQAEIAAVVKKAIEGG